MEENAFVDDGGNWKFNGTGHTMSRSPLTAHADNIWQIWVVYYQKMEVKRPNEKKGLFRKKYIIEEIDVPFTFYSDTVFTSKEECGAAAGIYIKKLVENKDLPKEVINEDNSVNEDLVKAGVRKLHFVMLDRGNYSEG